MELYLARFKIKMSSKCSHWGSGNLLKSLLYKLDALLYYRIAIVVFKGRGILCFISLKNMCLGFYGQLEVWGDYKLSKLVRNLSVHSYPCQRLHVSALSLTLSNLEVHETSQRPVNPLKLWVISLTITIWCTLEL